MTRTKIEPERILTNFLRNTLTDINGNYEFAELAPNNYIVVAQTENFQTEAIGATVVSNQTTTVNFSLAIAFSIIG